MASYFKSETRENILIAYFDNHEHSNALGIDAARELHQICKHAEKKGLRGLIITSDYRIFCSGGHLTDYAKLKTPAQGLKINSEITDILDHLSELDMLTICLVRGDCFGGGIEWISAFDKVFALPHVLFGMWQRKIGLSWGWGGAHRLKNRVTHKELQNLFLSAENFSAYRAQDLGLVDNIFDESFILEKAMTWIQLQIDLPQLPLEKVKKGKLKKEKKIFTDLWLKAEHKDALKKFTSKRFTLKT